MRRPLGPSDFPLMSIGANVYRRTESSPLFVAADSAMATDLVARLNQGEEVLASGDRAAWAIHFRQMDDAAYAGTGAGG